MTDALLTDRELASLRNMGKKCEAAADEIERLRADLAVSMDTAHRAQKMAAQLLNERAAAPPGWVLVPVEPSRPMLLAGAVADCGPDDDGVHRLEPWLKALWAAMLAAAPDAQKGAQP